MKRFEYVNIPGFFTFLNLFWGLFAIERAIQGRIDTAAWFIIIAVLCDGIDGKIARWTGHETAFGIEQDSLADLISSGVAPAVLMYQMTVANRSIVLHFLLLLFVWAGGYRLARYNVSKSGGKQKGYSGLPLPTAAMTVSALILFKTPFNLHVTAVWWYLLIPFLALMMISQVPYNWPKLNFKSGWGYRLLSVLKLTGTACLILFPRRCLFPLHLVYIVAGLTVWSISLFKNNREDLKPH